MVLVETVRIGVAGLGAIAQVAYLPLLDRRRDLFRLAAVCDLDREHAEWFGHRFGVPAYDDPERMLDAGGCDALLVLTSGSHGALVRAALERGRWVLSEAPLGYSRAELSDLPDAARLMVGYMKQYDPAAQRLLECLHEAGGPEVIRHLCVTVLRPPGRTQLLFAKPRGSHPSPARLSRYADADERSISAALGEEAPKPVRRLYAEVLLEGVCLELSLIRMFTGAPASVDHVAVWPAETYPPSVEASGALPGAGRYGLHWHFLTGYPAYHQTVALHHEHGSFELSFRCPYLLNTPSRLLIRSRIGTTERTLVFEDVAEAFERQLVAFHRFVTQDERPVSGLAEALTDIAVAQRMIRRYAEAAGEPVGGECATLPAGGG
jgi:predicted dehydrogenase